MDFNPEFLKIFSIPWVTLTAACVFSFIVTFLGIPSVVKISRIKGLYDIPGERTSHLLPTPRLGGSMIFSGAILSSVLFTSLESAYELKYIIAGMIVLFFIGLKDDIVSLVPIKKAGGQLIAALIIVVAGNIRLTIGAGLSMPDYLSYLISIVVTLILVMTLINSINLIDGIDGLASGIGIIGSVSFGIWFIMNGFISFAVICLSLAGSLFSFLWFNLFSKKFKIFLGDTGSMIIGFLLAVFVIRFLETGTDKGALKTFTSAPAIAFSILILPLFDTLRICVVRLLQGKSIFRSDNNHIHHYVLRISGTHLKATVAMLLVNIALIALTILNRDLGNISLFLLLLLIATGISLGLYFYLKKHPGVNNSYLS